MIRYAYYNTVARTNKWDMEKSLKQDENLETFNLLVTTVLQDNDAQRKYLKANGAPDPNNPNYQSVSLRKELDSRIRSFFEGHQRKYKKEKEDKERTEQERLLKKQHDRKFARKNEKYQRHQTAFNYLFDTTDAAILEDVTRRFGTKEECLPLLDKAYLSEEEDDEMIGDSALTFK
ncbi:hypothetical protein ABG067_008146, partial [Albugo candida]